MSQSWKRSSFFGSGFGGARGGGVLRVLAIVVAERCRRGRSSSRAVEGAMRPTSSPGLVEWRSSTQRVAFGCEEVAVLPPANRACARSWRRPTSTSSVAFGRPIGFVET